MRLIDSTLREGEQMAGVYFTLAQKREIIRWLAAIGIEEIELGIAAMAPEMPDLIALARQAAPRARLALWCRGCAPDIRESADLSPDVLSISLPVSDLHIRKRLGKDRSWLMRQVSAVIATAREQGIAYVSLGLEDATRADTKFLHEIISTAERAGADRIRLSDTIGQATPQQVADLVRDTKRRVGMHIGVHTHNDFGMATANAIAALDAGADWSDVTILGLGERAGAARLEEVVGYLALARDHMQYEPRFLHAACRKVARMTRMTIPPHHPIVGARIFACETGLHLDGLAKDPATYEPFQPERVLGARHHRLGKKVGRNAVFTQLRAMGCAVTREEAHTVTIRIRALARRLGRPLSTDELCALVAHLRSGTTGSSCRQTG